MLINPEAQSYRCIGTRQPKKHGQKNQFHVIFCISTGLVGEELSQRWGSLFSLNA
jgi:hypothetical protein